MPRLVVFSSALASLALMVAGCGGDESPGSIGDARATGSVTEEPEPQNSAPFTCPVTLAAVQELVGSETEELEGEPLLVSQGGHCLFGTPGTAGTKLEPGKALISIHRNTTMTETIKDVVREDPGAGNAVRDEPAIGPDAYTVEGADRTATTFTHEGSVWTVSVSGAGATGAASSDQAVLDDIVPAIIE